MSTYPRTGLQRILSGAPNPVLRATLVDQDGEPVTADQGTVTCTVTRSDGTLVGAADRATTDTNAGVTCQLTTAEGATLDVLTATWRIAGVTRHVSHHRIIGAWPFSLFELSQRAGIFDGFDRSQLFVQRDRVLDLVEDVTGVAWQPQYDVTRHHFRWQQRLVLRRPLRAVRSIVDDDGIALDLTDLEIDHGAGIADVGGPLGGWYSIGQEHGYDRPPADLLDAMLTLAADGLRRDLSTVARRARTVSDGLGVTQQFGWAGPGHPTGIDDVDAVLMRYAGATDGIA